MASIENSWRSLKHAGLKSLNLNVPCYTGINLEMPLSAFATLGTNLPQLKELNFISVSTVNVVNSIIQFFPNLERLEFDNTVRDEPDLYVFQDGLVHENLKTLKILESSREEQNFPQLIACCKKLEKLVTTLCKDGACLMNVLTLSPNLDAISLVTPDGFRPDRVITLEYVSALKSFGKKLTKFHTDYARFDGVTAESLKKDFEHQFSYMNLGKSFSMAGLLLTNDASVNERHSKLTKILAEMENESFIFSNDDEP